MRSCSLLYDIPYDVSYKRVLLYDIACAAPKGVQLRSTTHLFHALEVRPQLQLPVHGDGQLAQEGQALGAGVAPRLGIGI